MKRWLDLRHSYASMLIHLCKDEDSTTPMNTKKRKRESNESSQEKKAENSSTSNGTNDDSEHEEEEADSSKPLCKYGAECYRKNPLHFQQFRHPHLEVTPKSKKAKK